MPIVFVHGVNNRKEDAGFLDDQARKQEYLKTLLAGPLGLDVEKTAISFPYWGGDGVKFLWNQASLPGGGGVEALAVGQANAEIDLRLQEAREQAGTDMVNLGDLSRAKGFAEAVDLVWDTASATSNSSQNVERIAAAYEASQRYLQSNPAPAWAMKTPPLSNAEFVDELMKGIKAHPDGDPKLETLSLSVWLQSTREALARLGSAPGDAITAATLSLARKSLHTKASRFLGDVFVYLRNRGTAAVPGPIVNEVLGALRTAEAAKKSGDDKLIIIGHSLGGVIVYDILTYFAPDLKVDYLVTVGSQVGLFEEMSLFGRVLPAGMPTEPKKDRISPNPNVAVWLNVFDTNDVFSFCAEGIYQGVQDFQYDTGYGMLEAHGGYFARPSFYKRLRMRLAQ
ncbi:hypothetical protein ACFSQQ_15905 [Mesorhizobium kowhaii]|uniref:hypothetical protein n=1 Tax=Mesorhizobium kowhaii TaxID=1300272 RepID=UPI0035E622D5